MSNCVNISVLKVNILVFMSKLSKSKVKIQVLSAKFVTILVFYGQNFGFDVKM